MECLDPLERYIHEPNSKYDAIIKCLLVHYQFETIHPFVDGNGRVGRLVLALMLKESCGFSKHWLYMSEFFERHREEYIQRLFEVSTKARWHEWVHFCLIGLREQAQTTIARFRRLLAVRDDSIERVNQIGGSTRLHQILENVFKSPFVRISDLRGQLDVSYPTAKSDVDKLVSAGVLHELPNLYPKTFYAPAVFNIAYEDLESLA